MAEPGEVAEWSNASDLKSDEPQGSVGSNPTLSVLSTFAIYAIHRKCCDNCEVS